MKDKKKKQLAMLGIVIFGLFFVVAMQVPYLDPTYTGYDGLTIEFDDIDHDYDSYEKLDTASEYGIDPDGGFFGDPTGLKAQISQPEVISYKSLSPITTERVVTIDGEEYRKTVDIKRTRYTFETVVDIRTYTDSINPRQEEDLLAIKDVTFWFKLANNDDSIFTEADEQAVSIITVVTDSTTVLQKGKDIVYSPAGGGKQFKFYEIPGNDIDSDFEAELRIAEENDEPINVDNYLRHDDVRFAIDITKADPLWDVLSRSRVDCQVEYVINVDCVVLGAWEELAPYREDDPPDPDLTFWQKFFEDIGKAWDEMETPFQMMLVAVIFVAGAVILVKIIGVVGMFGSRKRK